MQNIKIDGTVYTISNTRDPIELAKLARKPYKPKKISFIRKFPVRADLSTKDYIRQFESLNNLIACAHDNASAEFSAQYDTSIPLLEVLE